MPAPIFPLKLSTFVKDIDKSFWNGDGNLALTVEKFTEAIENNPSITVGGLREVLRQKNDPPLVQTGLDFKFTKTDQIRLGERRGTDTGFWIGFNVNASADAWLYIVLAQGGLKALESQNPQDLQALLSEHTVLSGQDALIVVSFTAVAGGSLASTVLNKPGLNVGVTFKAGASFEWFYCRPASDQQVLLEAVRDTFKNARLPQTSLSQVRQAGFAPILQKNELLYSRFAGFMNLGVETSFGYSFTGTRNVSLGKLDLATNLSLQARARLTMGYSLAGAFRLMVLPGTESGWLRVLVEKDHSSGFDFAVGVQADAQLQSTGLPDSNEGPLALVEAIVGVSMPQVVRESLAIAQMNPQELRDKADGFLKGVVEKWVGKAFDQVLNTELEQFLSQLNKAVETVNSVDSRLIQLYEKFLGQINFEDIIKTLNEVLAAGDSAEERKQLVQRINSPELRQFLELLVNLPFSEIFLRYDLVRGQLVKLTAEFEKLVTGTAKDAIQRLVRAKMDALGLTALFKELAEYDTPAKLQAKATQAARTLVERLVGKSFDQLMKDPRATAIVAEVNRLASKATEILDQVNQVVHKALNAKGRFDISAAYHRAQENEKLVDIQIRVDPPDPAARDRSLQLYEAAVRCDFASLLRDENRELVRIGQAVFTDTLRKSGELQVHIFGWDYQSVSSILSKLESSVTVGSSGLMTVYKLEVEGKTLTESQRRATELNYLLQVAGASRGAFEADDQLRRQAVDAFAVLRTVQTRFRYQIKDSLTSLDELSSYFDLGVQLNMLSPAERANLIATIQELRRSEPGREPSMDENAFGRVGVTYTVSFAGEALAEALRTDFTGAPIRWWNDAGKEVRINAANHRQAIESMYLDRLLASYFMNREPSAEDYAVPALFLAGIQADFRRQPLPSVSKQWSERPPLKLVRDGRAVEVRITLPAAEWARRHYLVSRDFSATLDRMRGAFRDGTTMRLGDLEEFLKKLVENLKEIGSGPHAVLPFMVIDEMVRRAGFSGTNARTAVLEIVLFDREGKEAHYIPITG